MENIIYYTFHIGIISSTKFHEKKIMRKKEKTKDKNEFRTNRKIQSISNDLYIHMNLVIGKSEIEFHDLFE